MLESIEDTSLQSEPLVAGELLAVTTYGEFLARARDNTGLGQDALTDNVNSILAAGGKTQIGWQAYSGLERNERFPNFEESYDCCPKTYGNVWICC